MVDTLSSYQNCVILHNVRWETYQVLVKDRALKVAEIWRFDGQVLNIYQLVKGEYQDCQVSRIFPFLRSEDILLFLRQSQGGEIALVKAFRLWVKGKLSKS